MDGTRLLSLNVRHTGARLSEKRTPEDELVAGIDLSARDMASLIADALIDGGVVKEDERTKCEEIAAEEIWVRKLLVDGPPKQGA